MPRNYHRAVLPCVLYAIEVSTHHIKAAKQGNLLSAHANGERIALNGAVSRVRVGWRCGATATN